MRLSHKICAGILAVVSLFMFASPGSLMPLRAQDFTEFRKINEAQRLATTGDPAQAVAALRDLLEHHNYPTLWYYLGIALSRAGDMENARKAFKKVGGFQARIGLARTFLLAGQLEQAEKEGRRILGKEANAANAHYIFAVLHFFGGDFDQALAEVDGSIKTDPNFAPAFLLKYQALLPRHVTRPGPGEILNKSEQVALSMRRMDAVQSLKTYLALTPAERNNDFLLDQLDAMTVYAEAAEADQSSDKHFFSNTEVTTKARVLSKPEPQYSSAARSAQVVGTVVLRAVFSANGNVEHILAIMPLPFGLTEKSIEAAKQIKFTPATKDGRPVSMVMQLEYNFNLY